MRKPTPAEPATSAAAPACFSRGLVFPVRNVRAALEHYRRLGFVVEAYAVESEGDPIYRPVEARKVLQELASGKGLVAFEAGEALKRWEEGSWQLDPA
jgi:hypothetical protein